MTVRVVLVVVVVGSVTVVETKLAPHAIVLGVPSSVIWISRISPSLGVPDKFDVIDVIAAASAVSLYTSTLSVLIVGVADEAVDPTLAFHLVVNAVPSKVISASPSIVPSPVQIPT
jgi:hypothetical protein